MRRLREELDRYLMIRRSLGYDLSTTERVLRRFIAFAESQSAVAHHHRPVPAVAAKLRSSKATDLVGAPRHGPAVRAMAAWARSGP